MSAENQEAGEIKTSPGKAGRPPSRKCLSDALRLALEAKQPGTDERKVRVIAEKLVDKAINGDLEAIKIVFDRVEGKAPQPLVGDGEFDPIAITQIVRRVVDPRNPDA